MISYEMSGLVTTCFTVVALLLFTLFNVEVMKYNRKGWLAMQLKVDKINKNFKKGDEDDYTKHVPLMTMKPKEGPTSVTDTTDINAPPAVSANGKKAN